MEESETRATRSYHASGISKSQVNQGNNNSIRVTRLSSEQNSALEELFSDLYFKLADTPLKVSDHEDAVEQVEELKSTVTNSKAPDVGRMRSVISWFKDHIPALAGAVVSIVVNPIVGQLISAGGDLVVREYNQLKGEESAQ